MVRLVLLALFLASPAWAWEITVAFTTDLHAHLHRFPALEKFLPEADLLFDGGDAWEDTWRSTGAAEAWATMRWMAKVGYEAMVLGNHETYLGPKLLNEILAETPFPVLATNLRADIPVRSWALFETRGVRVLVLGVLWDLAIVWPGWEILDPQAAIEATLKEAPEHDVWLLLGHLDFGRAERLAKALPLKPALFILGHGHKMYERPVWVDGVPIVQAGCHGRALGKAKLGPTGLIEYQLILVPEPVGLQVFALKLLQP